MFAINQISARKIRSRRLAFVCLLSAIFGAGFLMMLNILVDRGFTGLEFAILILFSILFALVAFGTTLALTGFWVLRWGGDPFRITNTLPLNAAPGPLPNTAVVMPIFNEEVGRVFQAIRLMFESVEKTGHGEAFDFFILSDSNDPNQWIEEEKAWLELCKAVSGFGRIFYRKRRVALNHKSGNIADFCRRWGANYRYMIVLDADSIMTGSVFVKLVQLMERNRSVGIIQTAPQPALGKSLFSRIQQFAGAVNGPIFSAGANFWHLGGGNYWGHNAIIRVKLFMEHCALPELPKVGPLGGRILSHDTVEAAFMRTAGYGVWFAYDLEGSYEEGPPDLLASLKRDRRWCQGNMQHILVLLKRNLRAASRIHLLIGILSYLSAPLWLLFMILTSIRTFLELRHPGTGSGAIVWPPTSVKAGILFGYVIVLLLLPKALGLWHAWRRSDQVKAYQKRGKVLLSMIAETFFSMLLAPILMMFFTKFVISALTGVTVKWSRQNRGEERPSWRELLNTHGVQTVLALGCLAIMLRVSPGLAPWLAPVLAGLIFAMPFARLTSSTFLGDWARAHDLFLTPEEASAPVELQRIHGRLFTREGPFFRQPHYSAHYGLLQAVLDPYIHAAHVSLLRLREAGSEKSRQYMDDLSRRLLELGPAHLSPEERSALLWDADSMMALHKELWVCPPSRLDEWWQQALRHHNESLAITTRRSMT